MLTVHEPPPVGTYVRLLDGKVQIRENLNRLQKNSVFSRAVYHDSGGGGATGIVDLDSDKSKGWRTSQ